MKRGLWLLSVIIVTSLLASGLLLGLAAEVVLAAPVSQSPSPPFADPAASAQAAVGWLETAHQNSDGGYTSFSGGANLAPSDVTGTVDALLALASAGAAVSSPLDYLQANAAAAAAYAARGGAQAGKLTAALVHAGADPGSFGGHDLVTTLTGHHQPAGDFGVNTAFEQSLAILGVTAAGQNVPPSALDWLVGLQATGGDLAGSWDDGFGTAGNADTTGLALAALVAGGRAPADEPLSRARDFLLRSQQSGGGWEYGPGFGENANSTGLVILALEAMDEDHLSPGNPWDRNGRTPLIALLSWQAESGAFQADFGNGRFDDFFSTVQALPAIAAVAAMRPPAADPTAGGAIVPWLLIALALTLMALTALWLRRSRR